MAVIADDPERLLPNASRPGRPFVHRHRVTLFERFDAPRPVGSGLMLQPTCMVVLAELGLLDEAIRHGSRIDRLFGKAGKRVVLDVHYAALKRQAAFGIGIHRASLFAILHEVMLRAGITVHSDHEITGSEIVGSRRALRFGTDRSAPFELIVDALGTRTPSDR